MMPNPTRPSGVKWQISTEGAASRSGIRKGGTVLSQREQDDGCGRYDTANILCWQAEDALRRPLRANSKIIP